jgi:hypothetical protein
VPLPMPRDFLLLGACCSIVTDPNLHGRWVDESFDLLRLVMHRMEKKKLPFAWVRWGDGEMMTAAQNSPYGNWLGDSLLVLASRDDAVVNVGMHWLKSKGLASSWNKAVPVEGDFLFHEFFYLPIGDPVAQETKTWQHAGIVGWSKIKDRTAFCERNSLHRCKRS